MKNANTKLVAVHVEDHARLSAIVRRLNEVSGRQTHTLQSVVKLLLDVYQGKHQNTTAV
ncbi:hypothetical protein Q5H93_06190 [Hymenobacter sp. ASUV-10]|uniref:Uncharacterized protein n=1 Tax=Hymenobacter aranciens TaxID=3063996 RepID=A0ABT9B937_9BACT|nr:hypothetical protein [Hymenobacter sp. ASUV-10]MDO7874315.1 hypothetical protein [Hymenobacter sp. ASUV-10]